MEITRLTPYRSCSPGVSGFGSGVTHQEFRDLCDVNAILRRFKATGVLPQCQGLVSMPCDSFLYGDFSELQNTLTGAKNVHDLASSSLPSSEGLTQNPSHDGKEEGENGTLTADSVKGDAQANPGADA